MYCGRVPQADHAMQTTATQALPLGYPMNHYTPEQLATFPWIVSCDTLRPEDLLLKFWNAAESCAVWLDRPQLLNAETLASLQRLVGEDSSADNWDDDDAAQTLDDLTEALNDAAPVGFHFGASVGDGAAFGFWLGDDWREALETLGLDDDDPTGWAELIGRLDADGIDPDTVEDSYQGRAFGYSEVDAGTEYAAQLAEDCGDLGREHQRWPFSCIDWSVAWEELRTCDGYRLHDIGGGDWLAFRSV